MESDRHAGVEGVAMAVATPMERRTAIVMRRLPWLGRAGDGAGGNGTGADGVYNDPAKP